MFSVENTQEVQNGQHHANRYIQIHQTAADADDPANDRNVSQDGDQRAKDRTDDQINHQLNDQRAQTVLFLKGIGENVWKRG